MAQKRYFDYQSKLRSKTSAEAMALASAGIGVKYGFNKVSVSGNTFIISSDNTITLTNSETGALDEVKHVVITPDGIISAETDDIGLTLPDSQEIVAGDYFVLASHQHIESLDAIITTSYSLVKSSSSASDLISGNQPMSNWYDFLLESYPGFNKNTTIIVALISYTDSENINIYTPYNNVWPTKFGILDNKINNLNNDILGLMGEPKTFSTEKTVTQEGSSQVERQSIYTVYTFKYVYIIQCAVTMKVSESSIMPNIRKLDTIPQDILDLLPNEDYRLYAVTMAESRLVAMVTDNKAVNYVFNSTTTRNELWVQPEIFTDSEEYSDETVIFRFNFIVPRTT